MISLERWVDADTSTVWDVLGDLDHWAELLPTVDQVTRVGASGPVTVGCRFRLRQPGLLPAVYVVTDWRPPLGFTWESGGLGLRTVATHTLEPRGPATRLGLGIAWSGLGAGLARALLTSKARRYVALEAAAVARLAERGSAGADA